jgi:hypothetical protein
MPGLTALVSYRSGALAMLCIARVSVPRHSPDEGSRARWSQAASCKTFRQLAGESRLPLRKHIHKIRGLSRALTSAKICDILSPRVTGRCGAAS